MDEMDEQEKSKTMGCGCLLALIGCLIPLSICFFILSCFVRSIHNEVTNETVIFESSSSNEKYTLSVIQSGISFHGKYMIYIEVDDGTRIEVPVVSHTHFDASNVSIEWSDDNTATITLNGDYDQIISFIAPNMFELQ